MLCRRVVSEAREVMRSCDATEAAQQAGQPLPADQARAAAAAAEWVDAARRFQSRRRAPSLDEVGLPCLVNSAGSHLV